MKELWLIIKKYGELIASFVCGVLLNWFERLELVALQKIANLLMILLMAIGLIKYIFRNIRLPKWLYNLVHTQRSVKSVDYLNNPTKLGEQAGEMVVETIKALKNKRRKNRMKKFFIGIKNVFVWLWGNKSQLADAIYVFISGVIINLFIYSDVAATLLPEFLGATWCKVAITVVSVVMTIMSWINTATSRKFDSIATLVAAQKVKEEAKAKKTLKAEQYAKYNSIMKDLLDKKVELENVISSATKEIERINAKIELKITSEIVEQSNLLKLHNKISAANDDLANLKVSIKTVESKIEEYK